MHSLYRTLEEKRQMLLGNSYFSRLALPILDEISQAMALQAYDTGEVISWEGEPCGGLFVLERGSVKLFKTSLQGREVILRILEEGTTFNEVPVFDDGPNPVNVAALEACEVWVLEPDGLRKALARHPELAQSVIANLCQNMRNLVKMVEELSFWQVTNRLARLIESLPPERLDGESAQRLTQDQIAAHLGTVREVVGRSLRSLERSGAIEVDRGRIRVVNSEVLGAWSRNLEN